MSQDPDQGPGMHQTGVHLEHQISIGGQTGCEHDRIDVIVVSESGYFSIGVIKPEGLDSFRHGDIAFQTFDLASQ